MGQRYRAYYPKDDSAQTDGQLAWIGVRCKGEPDQLPEGYVYDGRNITFSGQVAQTRLGSMTPASFMSAQLAAPLYGAGIFSDPKDREWLLLAAGDRIWRMRDGCTARSVQTPAPSTKRVEFVQTFGSMLLFRGSQAVPWSWDGDVRDAFAPVPQTDLGDGTQPIPNGTDRIGLRPVVMNSRSFVPHDRNFLAVSDILDFTRYDNVFSDYYVGGANDHLLVALYAYQQSSLLVFLDQSIQILSGLTGDLSSAALGPVNDQIGCCAANSVAMVGSDVFFLSTTGVYRLSQVIQNRIQTPPTPVSEAIEPYIKRITWSAVAGACAAVIGRYYVLAVPLDLRTVNSALLVYDAASDAWHGIHTFPSGVQFDSLQVTDYQGEKRLYGIDFANARVHLLFQGRHDVIGSTVYDIPCSVEIKRCDLLQTTLAGQKRFRRGKVVLRGWNPDYSIALKSEGVNQVQTLRANVIKDRTRYKTHGAPKYNPANTGDNHGAPLREDYSVDIGTAFDPGTNGVDPDLEQTHTEPLAIRTQTRGASVIVSNQQGTMAVVAVELEGDAANRAGRPR